MFPGIQLFGKPVSGSNPPLVEVQGQEKAAGPETLPHLWPEETTATGGHMFQWIVVKIFIRLNTGW